MSVYVGASRYGNIHRFRQNNLRFLPVLCSEAFLHYCRYLAGAVKLPAAFFCRVRWEEGRLAATAQALTTIVPKRHFWFCCWS